MKKILFLLLLIFISCNRVDPLDESSVRNFITSKSFRNSCQYNTEDEIYTFEKDGSFIHVSESRRSNETKVYNGKYDILKSKFNDSRVSFIYLRLIYSNDLWTNVPEYFVFSNDNLTKPEYSGPTAAALNINVSEDSHGLNIPNYLVQGVSNCEIAFPETRSRPLESPIGLQNSIEINADSSRVTVDSSPSVVASKGGLTDDYVVEGVIDSIGDSNLLDTNENELVNNHSFESGKYKRGFYITNASKNKYVYFYNAPQDNKRRGAYFDSKEVVKIQEFKNGFGFVEFTNTEGVKSVGWIKMIDLITSK